MCNELRNRFLPTGKFASSFVIFASPFVNLHLLLEFTLGLLVALFSWLPFRRLLFTQVSGNVTVGDIITGRTIHCKSLDELLVKEDENQRENHTLL